MIRLTQSAKKNGKRYCVRGVAARASLQLACEQLECRYFLAAPSVADVSPSPNSHIAPGETLISVTFDQSVSRDSNQSFVVHGMQSGQRLQSPATVRTVSETVILNPEREFAPGELVQATVNVSSGDAVEPAQPFVWQFRAAVAAGTGTFEQDHQWKSDGVSGAVALGDLDGDGDLDAFYGGGINGAFGRVPAPNRVRLNDGQGSFVDSGQSLGDAFTGAVVLGDVDGDGDLDAFAANSYQVDFTTPRGERNVVWINDGTGVFSRGQQLDDTDSNAAAFGDLDGDGDLDVVVANSSSEAELYGPYPNKVWLNGGNGILTDSGQRLGNRASFSVVLGDVDGDGDLDALFGNFSTTGTPATLWLNDGLGSFEDSGQRLGDFSPLEVLLGDLDGDGDLDVYIPSRHDQNQVFWNDGQGRFRDSGQRLDSSSSGRGALGDVDGDGDLDILIAKLTEPDTVWLNDGIGNFNDSGQRLGEGSTGAGLLGDLDSDGDLDAYVYYREDWSPNTTHVIWKNLDTAPEILAGDANRDFKFDQFDVAILVQSGKYLTDEPASWAEGDFNDDGVFDQIDIVAALQNGNYLQEP